MWSPTSRVDAIVGFPFHRGVLACGERRPWRSLEEIVADRDRRLFLAICPKLSNPENLGALADRRRVRNRCDPGRSEVSRPALAAGAPRLDGHRAAVTHHRRRTIWRRWRAGCSEQKAWSCSPPSQSPVRNLSGALTVRDGLDWSSATSTRGSIRSGCACAGGPSPSRCARAPARSMSPWPPGS